MGEAFVERHPWAREPAWADRFKERLETIAKSGLKIGTYVPTQRIGEDN
jgi:hypothetical protein